jgi:hypothetical protein
MSIDRKEIIMNTPLRLMAAASMALLGAVHAAEADLDYPWHNTPFVQKSDITRADVSAGAQVARMNQGLDVGEAGLMPAAFVATKSRAQVVAELREARRLGLVGHGEVGAPSATPEQLRMIAGAGLRARGDSAIAQMR